jgi:hypothetical protein
VKTLVRGLVASCLRTLEDTGVLFLPVKRIGSTPCFAR